MLYKYYESNTLSQLSTAAITQSVPRNGSKDLLCCGKLSTQKPAIIGAIVNANYLLIWLRWLACLLLTKGRSPTMLASSRCDIKTKYENNKGMKYKTHLRGELQKDECDYFSKTCCREECKFNLQVRGILVPKYIILWCFWRENQFVAFF